MPPGITLPAGMKHHSLPAGEETLEFWGRFIDAVDTYSEDRPRWAELRLYKMIDTNPDHDDELDPGDEDYGMFGKQMWLLYTVGHTLVYHQLDCFLNRGIVTSDFPRFAEEEMEWEPCTECSPPDWRSGGRFKREITWYTDIPCQSAEKVVTSLYREPRCWNCRHKPHGSTCSFCACADYKESPKSLSIPGRQLIEQVRVVDPEIARAAAKVKRL